MSALQKHVFRNDPERVARLAAIARKNGYVDSDGQIPGLGDALPGPERPSSQRRAQAEGAKIIPSRRITRSVSPGISAASRGIYGQDSSMPPPRRPATGLGVKERSIADEDNYEDMFGTDVENADATTTISNISADNTSAPWPQHLGRAEAKPSNMYDRNDMEYDEQFADDRHYLNSPHVTSQRDDKQVMEEGYAEDEESQTEASDEDQSQHSPFLGSGAIEVMIDRERSNGLSAAGHEPLKARQNVMQSLIDSPSTKRAMKSMAIRGKELKATQPEQIWSQEPRNMERQRTIGHNGFHDPNRMKREDPSKTLQKDREREFPMDKLKSLSHEFRQEELDEPPVKAQEWSNTPIAKAAVATGQADQLATSELLLIGSEQLPIDGAQPQAEIPVSLQGNQAYRPVQVNALSQGDAEKLEATVTNTEDVHLDPSAAKEPATYLTDQVAVPKNSGLIKAAGQPEFSHQTDVASSKSQMKKSESRKRAQELDYTPQEMSGMAYRFLNSESFDHIPKPSANTIPSDIVKASLSDKLKHAYELKDREDNEAQRSTVFASLTIDQYEETGDLIIEQFSNILGRYKNARRAKREAARELEKEIAQREARVRAKTTAVEEDRKRLKRGAEDVIRGPG